MKNIKRFLLLTAAVSLFAGCQQEDFKSHNGDSLVFTATIGNTTRTALDASEAGKVNWTSGDEISINGVAYVATPDASDASKATFTKKNESDADPEPVEGFYYATYGCTYDAASGEGALPESQTYVAGALNAPMYAESETTALSFMNITGVLELDLKGTAAVKSIEVSSDNLPMSGAFSIYDGQTATTLEGADKTVVLDCGEGVALSTTESTPFYVAVPDGIYSGMKISFRFADGGRQTFTRGSQDVEILANGLYTISLNVESINDGTAILPSGIEFNTMLKKLVADDPSTITSETVIDNNIKTIAFVTESTSAEGTEIQAEDSSNPIYITANADKSVVTVSTPAKVLYMNEDAFSMFAYFCALEGFDNLAAVNTSKTTKMSKMFYFNNETNKNVVTDNLALKELDLSSFNTSNVTDFSSMFNTAWNLEKVNLSSFDTKNAVYMNHMFCNCNSLQSVDFSSFNTENVTTMRYMFYHCWGLTNLDLSSFNTEKVTTFEYMFYYCKSIETLDVSSFKTPAATTFAHMFNSCYKLKKLNLSGFYGLGLPKDASGNITGMNYTFNQLGALEELWLGPEFASRSYAMPYTYIIGSNTQTPANNRTALCNTTGTLVIHCNQTVADWVAYSAFRWVNSGYKNQTAVPILFYDLTTGNELTVTWRAN